MNGKKKVASNKNLCMFNGKREIISWVPLGYTAIAVLLNALYMITLEVSIRIAALGEKKCNVLKFKKSLQRQVIITYSD